MAPSEGGAPGGVMRITQLVRFAMSGGVVAAVHIGAVTTLNLLGLPIQVALAIGYVMAISLHFTLNRQWVFASDGGYANGLSAQGIRYLVLAAVSYAVTAVSLGVLPDALGVPDLAVFLAVTIGIAVMNYLILRAWIFRSRGGDHR